MTPQELKNSILQLAIQGKLVEQRPEEGTAEELYREIQEEKRGLIKEGKIKKEKPLPEITEDEVPFEIPRSWKWVHLKDVGISQTGNTPSKAHPEYIGNNIPFITPGDIQNHTIMYDNQALSLSGKLVARLCGAYSILQVCIGGSIGKAAVTDREIAFNQQINAISPLLCNCYYVYAVLTSHYFTINMKKVAGGTATPIINKSLWDSSLIPFPPLAEQKRIVAKIEELLPLVDRYEQAWSRLEALNKRFPEDMKKSLLQQAIQGKLVEQRPEEGTAEELYREIQEEKRRLVREGKIKKEKPLPEIAEDEVPFKIPGSWKWVRLGLLTELITSGSRDWAKYYSDTGDLFLRMGNLSKNSFELRLDKIQRVTLPQNAEGKRTALKPGDLLFSITGDVGMLGLIPHNFGPAFINQHTAMLRFMPIEQNKYIPYLLLTDYAQKFYNGNQHGIKNSFRLDSIALLPVPFPPLAEQKRIVARLEELLPLCEKLKKEK